MKPIEGLIKIMKDKDYTCPFCYLDRDNWWQCVKLARFGGNEQCLVSDLAKCPLNPQRKEVKNNG